MALRLPNTPVERPAKNSQEAMEDQRQLAHWREQLYRMFQFVGTVTGTPGLIAAGAVGTLAVTVMGCFADQSQTVEIGAPSTIDAGLTWCGVVSANNTVTIRIHNGTGAGITPASAIWTARVTP